MMDLGIRDRVALVAAGTSGLGLAAAVALAREGVQVSLCGRDPDRLAAARDAVAKAGDGRVLASTVDVGDRAAVQDWVARTAAEFGAVHIVVGNSGGPPPGTLDTVDPDQYRDAFSRCVQPQITLTHAALPYLRTAGWGRVLLVASETVRQPILHYGLSSTVRPALLGFARTLAHTLGPAGITVNVLAPGYHRTAGLERMLGADAEPELDRIGRTGWVGRFAGVCAVLMLTFTGFGAVIPVLPFLVLEELDGTKFAVGTVFGVSALVALVGRPYAGRAAQRFGSRRVMLVGCLLAGLVGLLYAAPFGLPGLYGARLLHGVAESVVFTAGSVWVVAIAPQSRRGQLVGYYGLAMWTGLTVGPLVGTWLRSSWGYPAVWWLAALAPLVAAALLLLVPAPEASGEFTSRRLVPQTVLLPGTSLALAAFGYAALTGFVVLHLAERGIGNGGAMLSLFGAGYVVVRILAGRLPDRVGATRVVLVCGFVEALGLVLLTIADSFWLAALGALVMGAGFTLLYPSLALLVIKASPESERGAALGAYTSFWDLGLGVSGLVTGLVAAAGYPVVFVLAAVLAAAAGVAGGVAGLRAETTLAR